jgi:hypothetical protein
MPSDTLSDLSQRGLAIYNETLKSILEPQHTNRYVAIHVPTGDYALGASSGDAMRAILQNHPVDGQLIIRKIGPEPDYSMAARVMAGELKASSK